MSIIEKAAKRLAEKRVKERPEEPHGASGPVSDGGLDVSPPVPADDEWPVELESAPAEAAADPMANRSSWDGGDIEPVDGVVRDSRAAAVEHWQDTGGVGMPVAEGAEPSAQAGEAARQEAADPAWSNAAADARAVLNGVVPEPAETWTSTSAGEPDADSMIRITALNPETTLLPEGGRTRMAEEFRVIKRPLLMKAFGKGAETAHHSNLIMVSSSIQSEGKTFVSLNLAISIAMEMDSTVLLVDADVARPGLSKLLGTLQRPGLIERLTEEHTDLADLLMRTDIPKLTVLPAGERHKRSTELLASNKMAQLLDELSSRYSDRIVLFDSPPLLESTEASVLASQMGQLALVVESDATSRVLVKEALSLLNSVDNVSFVLNKIKENFLASKLGGYGSYSYGYGYYGDRDGE